jgi:hypothetical protein
MTSEEPDFKTVWCVIAGFIIILLMMYLDLLVT